MPKQKRRTEREVEDIEGRSTPSTPVIYEVVCRLGEEEMARPAVSLWWSGVAAGLLISFSLLAQAILLTHLPDAPWRPLIVSFGYSIGFVMVVLSRQQLFTETTITAVLPVMAEFTPGNLWKLARMWGIVLLANFAGTLFAALFCTFTPVLSPELKSGMLEISRQLMTPGRIEMVFKGISSGFLMAAMVAAAERGGGAIPRHGADDLAHCRRRLHAHRRRQHRSLSAGAQRRPAMAIDDRRLHRAGAYWQYRRGHCALCLDRLCAGHERNLDAEPADYLPRVSPQLTRPAKLPPSLFFSFFEEFRTDNVDFNLLRLVTLRSSMAVLWDQFYPS
jgi:hypothetical protein